MPFNVTADGTGNWNLTQALGNALTPGDRVACTAKNTLTQLNLRKVVSTGTARSDQFQLTATPVTDPGPTYDRDGSYTAFDPIAGGILYQLGESGPANYSQDGDWECTNQVTPNAQDQIIVPKGTQTRCTIKNTRDKGTITLTKVVDPAGAGDPASWTLSADPQNITGQALVSGNGKDGVDKVSVLTGTYALAEAPNPGPGFTKGAWNCGSATMPTATTVTVTTGQDVSCTIKNTRDKGTITLTKVVDPAGAGDPAELDVVRRPAEHHRAGPGQR